MDMTNEMLDKIKELAEDNLGKDYKDEGTVYAEYENFAVTNPWHDKTGRVHLDDVEAIREWGLATIIQFCDRARKQWDLD